MKGPRGLRPSPSMAVALLALVLAMTGGAYAAGASSSGTLSACIHHQGGGMYVAKRCAKHDRRISWNQMGPAGQPGAAATKYLVQVEQDGTVNSTTDASVRVYHAATGYYLVSFGVDVTGCVALGNAGGVPLHSSADGATAAANGYGLRVDIPSAGNGSPSPEFADGDTIDVSTFSSGNPADSSFYLAVLC